MESAALVAVTVHAPAEDGAVSVVVLMVQLPDATAYVTAPVPLPPEALNVVVAEVARVLDAAATVKVACDASTVTLTVAVAAAYVLSAALVAVTVQAPAVEVAVNILPFTVQLADPVVTAYVTAPVPEPPAALNVEVLVVAIDAGVAAAVIVCAVKVGVGVEELPPPHAVSSDAVASAQADRVMKFRFWNTARPPEGLMKRTNKAPSESAFKE